MTDDSQSPSNNRPQAPLELALVDGNLQLGGFLCTPAGLVLKTEIETHTAEQMGMLLFNLEAALPWLIGDWLVYMEGTKPGSIGEVAYAFGRDPQTLFDYAYVARSIDYSRRRNTLSFNHHKLIVRFSPVEQDQALQYAEENYISVFQFRKWIKAQTS